MAGFAFWWMVLCRIFGELSDLVGYFELDIYTLFFTIISGKG